MTRLMEMMGLGFMPRISFLGDGEGGGGAGGLGGDGTQDTLGTSKSSKSASSKSASSKSASSKSAPSKSAPAVNSLDSDRDIAEQAGISMKSYSANKGEIGGVTSTYDAAKAVAQKAVAVIDQQKQQNTPTSAVAQKAAQDLEQAVAIMDTPVGKIGKANAEARSAAAQTAAESLAQQQAVAQQKEIADIKSGKKSASNMFGYGYIDANGNVVTPDIDIKDGGGPGKSGATFGGLFGGISNAIGATPYGSNKAPTGLAKAAGFGYGYMDPETGNYVRASEDIKDGGGPGKSGDTFGGLFGGISNAIGATPYGSGLEPTGIAALLGGNNTEGESPGFDPSMGFGEGGEKPPYVPLEPTIPRPVIEDNPPVSPIEGGNVGVAGILPYDPYDPIVPVEMFPYEASPFYVPQLASESLLGTAPAPLPAFDAPSLIPRSTPGGPQGSFDPNYGTPPLSDASYQMTFDGPQEYRYTPFGIGV